MLRVFVDANVLVAGANSQSGASQALITLAELGLFQLVVCKQVVDEAERNLRKKLPRALPNFFRQMASAQPEIIPDPTPQEVKPWEIVIEAKDAPILCAAINSGAKRLVTLNTKDFTPAVAQLSGLNILTPAEFIQEIRHVMTTTL